MTRRKKTRRPSTIAGLRKVMRKRAKVVAAERDALREVAADCEELAASCDEAIEGIEAAIEALSRYA